MVIKELLLGHEDVEGLEDALDVLGVEHGQVHPCHLEGEEGLINRVGLEAGLASKGALKGGMECLDRSEMADQWQSRVKLNHLKNTDGFRKFTKESFGTSGSYLL